MIIEDDEKVVCYRGLKTFYENLKNEFVLKSEAPNNYNSLENKPQINSVELTGNKTLDDLGIQPKIAEVVETEEGVIAVVEVPLSTPKMIAKEVKAENLYTNVQVDGKLHEKVNVQQGVENVGKALVVGEDGNLVPGEVSGSGTITSITNGEIDEIMEGE